MVSAPQAQVGNRLGGQEFGSNTTYATVSTRSSTRENSPETNVRIDQIDLKMYSRKSPEYYAKQRELSQTIMDFDAVPGIRDMLDNLDLDAESDSESDSEFEFGDENYQRANNQ
jgi:hypothetical protein